MSDLQMTWAGDLGASLTGDMAVVSDPEAGTARVLRRLLTNPGDYIWHPEYGAGLGRFIGQPMDVSAIQALIREQMQLEPAVAQDPEPVIVVQSGPDGSLSVQIRYADTETALANTLSLSVPG